MGFATANAMQSTGAGNTDAFVAKINASLYIDLEGQGKVHIPNGGTYNMGITPLNTALVQQITVRNTSSGTLNLLTNPPTFSAGFQAGNFGSTSLTPGQTTTFNLTCLDLLPTPPYPYHPI